jgi:predicted nucleic acid-binding protein
MSAERLAFVDTNVLVYAHDASAGAKNARARRLIAELWEARTGCLSVQVLLEFFVTVTRKIPKPLAHERAARLVQDLSQWRVHSPQAADVLAATELQVHSKLSVWDAMIVRSARQLGCATLWTEDMGPGRTIAGVALRNPFA